MNKQDLPKPHFSRGWYALDLGAILDGAPVDTADVVSLPAERPMAHYRQ